MIFRLNGAHPHLAVLEEAAEAQRRAEMRSNSTRRRLLTLEQHEQWLKERMEAAAKRRVHESGEEGR